MFKLSKIESHLQNPETVVILNGVKNLINLNIYTLGDTSHVLNMTPACRTDRKNGFCKRVIKLMCVVLFILILVAHKNVAAAIIFSKEYSPYHLAEDFIVEQGDTLIIEPGVSILLDEGVNIRVMGVLLINGTVSDPVKLMPTIDSVGWGIIDVNSPGSECRIDNAFITDGRIITHDVSLILNNIVFVNRQQLMWDGAIARVLGGSVIITGCRITGSGVGEGFLIHDMENPVVKQCHFENIPDAVEFINIDNGLIRNNVFTYLPDDAIDLNNCSNIIIDSNIIIAAEDRGIEIGSENFGNSENIIVNRNLIIGCNEGVIFKENSFGILSNNTFYQNNIAVSCIESAKSNTGSSAIILNSIFSQSVDADFYIDEASNVDVSYSLSDFSLPEGLNNLYDDPLLVNPQGNDFSLLFGSPCINAGNPESPYDPDNTISDMGAFYYNTDTSFIENSELVSVEVYPNPFHDKFYITYQLYEESAVDITLFDISGAIIKSVIIKNQFPGNHKIKISDFVLSSNSPIVCKVTVGDSSKKFVLISN